VGLFHKGMSRKQLKREGTRAEAEILDIHYTGTRENHGPIFAVKLAVRRPTKSPFEVDAKINASMVNPPRPGQVIPILYDPDHPSALIWDEEEGERRDEQAVESRRQAAFGATTSSSGGETVLSRVEVVNASGADPATVLEKLAQLKDQGLITDEQFKAAQTQVDGQAPSASASESPDINERLQRLEQLRAQNLVTDEEYAAQRSRILASL
jgi:hypothetical protein